MTEPGSDELLRQTGATSVDAGVHAERARLAREEQRVSAIEPAENEPGHDHDTRDETPPLEDAPDYDPLPPA